MGSPGGEPAPEYHEMVYGATSGEKEKNSLMQVPSLPYRNEDVSGEASSEYVTKSKYDFGKFTQSSFSTWEIALASTEDPCLIPKELQSKFISAFRNYLFPFAKPTLFPGWNIFCQRAFH
jgi:hypothetical protein